jgi:hypothetical protein
VSPFSELEDLDTGVGAHGEETGSRADSFSEESLRRAGLAEPWRRRTSSSTSSSPMSPLYAGSVAYASRTRRRNRGFRRGGAADGRVRITGSRGVTPQPSPPPDGGSSSVDDALEDSMGSRVSRAESWSEFGNLAPDPTPRNLQKARKLLQEGQEAGVITYGFTEFKGDDGLWVTELKLDIAILGGLKENYIISPPANQDVERARECALVAALDMLKEWSTAWRGAGNDSAEVEVGASVENAEDTVEPMEGVEQQ